MPVESIYSFCQSGYNLIYNARKILQSDPIIIYSIHIYLHQEKYIIWAQLPPLQQENIVADRKNDKMRESIALNPRGNPVISPDLPICLTINSISVTSKVKQVLQQSYMKEQFQIGSYKQFTMDHQSLFLIN